MRRAGLAGRAASTRHPAGAPHRRPWLWGIGLDGCPPGRAWRLPGAEDGASDLGCARTRAAALSRLLFQPGSPPLLVVTTGPYVGEGFDCPAPGHPVPGRSRQMERTPRSVRRANPPPLPRQGNRRDPRLPRRPHRSARRNARRPRPRNTSLGFPDPRRIMAPGVLRPASR
jgi:hypothetical protein